MYGGKFMGCVASEYGGAIVVFDEESKCTLNGVFIQGCKAGISGGGVYNNHGILPLEDTDITLSEAVNKGGAIYNGGTVNMTGGALGTNTAAEGAGIYCTGDGVAKLYDVTSSSNSGNGASVTCEGGGRVELYDCTSKNVNGMDTFYDNKAEQGEINIWAKSGGTIVINGGYYLNEPIIQEENGTIDITGGHFGYYAVDYGKVGEQKIYGIGINGNSLLFEKEKAPDRLPYGDAEAIATFYYAVYPKGTTDIVFESLSPVYDTLNIERNVDFTVNVTRNGATDESASNGVAIEYAAQDQGFTGTAPTDAGTYRIKVTLSGDYYDHTNEIYYPGIAAKEFSITIDKAALSGLGVSVEDWTYGEEASSPLVTGNNGEGALTYLYTGTTTAGEEYSSSEAPVDAGNYTLAITAAETANYYSGNASDEFAVNRAVLTDNTQDVIAEYDALEHFIDVSLSGFAYGEQAADIGEFSYGLTGDDLQSAGIGATHVADGKTVYYKVEFDNYETVTGSRNITINKAVLTDDTAKELTTVYDGNGHSVGVELSGFKGAEDVVTANGVVEYALSDDWGQDAPVFVETIEGASVSYRATFADYETVEGSYTVTIEKATLSDVTQDVDEVYGGEPRFVTVALDGFVNGEDMVSAGGAVEYSLNGTDGWSADNVQFTDVTEAATVYYRVTFANYETVTGDRSVTIRKATLSDITQAVHVVYDGKEHSIEVVLDGFAQDEDASSAGVVIEYGLAEDSFGADNFAFTDATEAVNVYYKATSKNYEDVTGFTTVTIDKATLVDDTKAVSVTYDKKEHYAVVELSGFVDGENAESAGVNIEYSKNGVDGWTNDTVKFVDATEPATVYYRAVSGNYNDVVSSVTVEIKKADIGVEVYDLNAVYDNNAHYGRVAVVSCVEGDKDELVPEYSVTGKDGDWSQNYVMFTDATSTQVMYRIVHRNYNTATGTIAIELAPKEVLTVWSGEYSFVYDGKDKSQSAKAVYTDINGTVKDAMIIVKEGDGAINAGEYTLVASATQNYKLTDNERTLVISKAPNSVTVYVADWVEGSAANVPTADTLYGTASFAYSAAADGEYVAEAPATAGEYFVIATVAESQNYLSATSEAFRFHVRARILEAPEASVDTGVNGIDPSAMLSVREADSEDKIDDYKTLDCVNLSVSDGSKNIFTEGTLTVKLLIGEEYRGYDNLHVFGYDANGNLVDMNAQREGDYLVFGADALSDFYIATPESYTGWIVGVTVGAVVVLGLAAGLVVLIIKKREA